jgi:8-oxo-dGTP pyrophosphatase MutT (NUDIX family)
MKLLATFRAKNVGPGMPASGHESFAHRVAVRAIVFDGNKVALIYVRKHDYYMLPGGGVEDEDIASALSREIQEEVGCGVSMTGDVGRIVVYFDRWKQKQTDYCYTALKIRSVETPRFTNFEKEEDCQIIWAKDLHEAAQLVKTAAPANPDGQLVRARDLRFLEELNAKSY